MTRSLRRRVRLSAGLVVALCVPLGLASTASADDAYFAAVASATAVDTTATPGNQLLGATQEIGGIFAQAQVDATGKSTAIAAHPYPGSTVTGTVAMGGQDYPFAVTTSFPDRPKASQDLTASKLQAESTATSSKAAASGTPTIPAGNAAGTLSTADVVQSADGTVTAVADADVQAITIAGVLTLSHVRSHAKISRSPTGKISHESSFTVGAASVAGQRVSIGSDGVSVLGTAVRPPSDALDAAANGVLTTAGITITKLTGATSETSAQSSALHISFANEVPNVGPVDMNLLIGLSRATLAVRPGLGGPETSTPDGGSFPDPPTSGPPTLADPPTDAGTGVVPSGSDAGSLPTAPDVAPTVPVQQSSGDGVPAASVRRVLTPYSWISLYVIALSAAALAAAGGLLIRNLGVRAR